MGLALTLFHQLATWPTKILTTSKPLGPPNNNSPSIRQDAIINAYKAAIGHVFERGERPSATRGPNIPTWTQLNGAKESLDSDKKIARCYARLRKKPCGPAKWNLSAPYGSKEAHLPPPPASLPPPMTPQKKRTTQTTTIHGRGFTSHADVQGSLSICSLPTAKEKLPRHPRHFPGSCVARELNMQREDVASRWRSLEYPNQCQQTDRRYVLAVEAPKFISILVRHVPLQDYQSVVRMYIH